MARENPPPIGTPSRPSAPRRNAAQRIDGFALLRALPDRSCGLAFFDPQYRGIMDKMAYGNEGARQKARAKLPQMSDADIALFVEQLERVLRPSRYLMLWTDKYYVGEGRHMRFFRHAPHLRIVDLGFWNKLRPGMGKRFRNVTEVLVVAQKMPVRAKGTWNDHRILDSWAESTDRRIHPHAKPHVLTERLIRATTNRGDLVVDPCAGGYGVLRACEQSGRDFIGCDLAGT